MILLGSRNAIPKAKFLGGNKAKLPSLPASYADAPPRLPVQGPERRQLAAIFWSHHNEVMQRAKAGAVLAPDRLA